MEVFIRYHFNLDWILDRSNLVADTATVFIEAAELKKKLEVFIASGPVCTLVYILKIPIN